MQLVNPTIKRNDEDVVIQSDKSGKEGAKDIYEQLSKSFSYKVSKFCFTVKDNGQNKNYCANEKIVNKNGQKQVEYEITEEKESKGGYRKKKKQSRKKKAKLSSSSSSSSLFSSSSSSDDLSILKDSSSSSSSDLSILHTAPASWITGDPNDKYLFTYRTKYYKNNLLGLPVLNIPSVETFILL